MEFHDAIEAQYKNLLNDHQIIKRRGRITKVVGMVLESVGPITTIGEKCLIRPRGTDRTGFAEVVGFRDNRVLLMPLEEIKGVGPGSEVITTGDPFYVNVGPQLIGRIVDGFGNPIDGKGPILYDKSQPIENRPPMPMERQRIYEAIATGIRSIDSFLTLGKGQKVGIFSGSGVGKSVMMSMIARNTSADVNVIGLIGERGREVKEFIERDLGDEGMARSVVVVVTSDEAALRRIKGIQTATAIAEYFRDQGNDVMLLVDSATRIAMAQREVGLSIGEPPTTRGYPPSTYALLPRLLERTGTSDAGTITAIYTVLVEGDDLAEPITDAMRAILDGHIVLSRRLASANHYPAVDILESVSRLMPDVTSREHLEAVTVLKDLLATYRDAEDLINIGAYSRGTNPTIDRAIDMHDDITAFLKQGMFEKAEFKTTVDRLLEVVQTPQEATEEETA